MEIDRLQEVLLLFAYKEDEQSEAELAFNELYVTYNPFLFALVRKKLNQMGIYSDQTLSIIVNNTFLCVYDKPPLEFKAEVGGSVDSSFKAYLSKICQNEIFDLLKEESLSKLTFVEELNDLVFEGTDINIDDSVNMKHIEAALNTLNDRDREILCTLYLYHEKGRKTPSEVLDTICYIHGTTRSNIRKIKQRGEEKIQEYFSKVSNLIPKKNVK